DQCLVFFLGGPAPPVGGIYGPQGFATDPTNPVNLSGDRVGPFFTFDSARLVDGLGGRTANGFPSYLDPWRNSSKLPYHYFSSYNQTNGYHPKNPNDTRNDTTVFGVYPYFESQGRFLNPNTFQIHSAGKDGQFGSPEGPNSWQWPASSPTQ